MAIRFLDSYKQFLDCVFQQVKSTTVDPPCANTSRQGPPPISDHLFKTQKFSQSTVRNIPKFKDRANWSRDTFQPMRRRACVYQQTNQNITPVIKNFQNSGRSRTESVIVSRLSGIFLRLFMRHTQFFKWTAYRKPYWKCLVKYSAHFVAYFFF